jgi:hypothetical protein
MYNVKKKLVLKHASPPPSELPNPNRVIRRVVARKKGGFIGSYFQGWFTKIED